MAGPLNERREIDIVVVGADRIAANGDTAKKVGTYTVAAWRTSTRFVYIAEPISPTTSAPRKGS